MMDQNEIEQKIFDWLESKSFDELTGSEQELVLSVLSKSEYQNQRKFLKESSSIFESERPLLVPDLAIHNALKSKINNEETSQGLLALILGVLDFKLPVYQPALALGAIFIFFWFFGLNSNPEIQIIEKEIVVYKPQIDTVTVEKIVEVPVVQEKEVVRYVYQKRNTDLILDIDAETNDNMAIGLYAPEEKPQLEDLKSGLGNSSINSEDLLQFRAGL